MYEPDFIIEPLERVFRPAGSPGRSAALATIGGLVLLGVAALGFLVALAGHVSDVSLHLMTTMPVLLGIGALASARATARTPREVRVSRSGLQLTTSRDTQTYEWAHVGWSSIEVAPLSNRRILKIFDVEGRLLATLSDAIADFDAMAEAIAGRIAAKGDRTAERVQLTKARRTAVMMALGGIAFLALSIAVASMTRDEIRAERLLKSSAVPGEAQIEKRFLAPNGITPRLVYRITTKDGKSASRNAEVLRPVWDALEGAEKVAVVYVPDEPKFSRLAHGEAPERDSFKDPVVGYGLPALVALMSLFFLVASAFMWRGWDIDLDSKTGKISVKRFGTGR